jgi:hypothetical protein
MFAAARPGGVVATLVKYHVYLANTVESRRAHLCIPQPSDCHIGELYLP